MDDYIARLETLAVMQTLNAEILGAPSATLTLENWCRRHGLAAASKITAHLPDRRKKLPTRSQLHRLRAGPPATVKFRHVCLNWGETIVSEAHNWYLPGRLTKNMNKLLETTDTPFGKVVRSLKVYRQTFSSRLLWSPLPDGWEMMSREKRLETIPGPVDIPDAIFEHRAILYDRTHRPVSEVWEVYRGSLLKFGH